MILSNYAIGGAKKSKFITEQEAKGLLSNLGIKTLFHYYVISTLNTIVK